MKLLIIRLGKIGDVVMTTPVVRCLKNGFPDAELHYLSLPAFAAIPLSNPYIHTVHLAKEVQATAALLQQEAFDHIIDLQDDNYTRELARICRLRPLKRGNPSLRKRVYTTLKWNLLPRGEHEVDRFMQALAPLGITNDGKGLDYFIPQKDVVEIKDIPASHHLGFVAFVIGASCPTKKMPLAKWKELCSRIDHPVILVGGREEFGEGEEIRKIDPVKLYNACGKFNLHESADLLRKSKLVVTHDTGLMHIAAALQKPVVAIWGSTTPSLGLWPYYGAHFLSNNIAPFDNVQVGLWCRPCTEEGRRQCPLGHFHCMKKIDIGELVRIIRTRLGRS